ncbi:conserved hypothetical protein [Cupriavidus necator]|uniref:Uncharacterized protein n=1 Tax=Cupriavidus necator TaxID=106590 RepID=A0A1K0J5X1_CUPNE|nr:conserved hypothetical protein [Cupriavidus necator]
MAEPEFNEVAGRIEGVSRCVLRLVETLAMTGVIDGPRFADGLRTAVRPNCSPAHLEVAARTLQELAASLDDARSWRQSRPEA